ncbi:hypothetical protein FS749_007239 [Ceratobasidium sp. UAMH 11750]|nr:hypothetical protein FS749_007239 [Ceratobasidium sp. UAMH 11750]
MQQWNWAKAVDIGQNTSPVLVICSFLLLLAEHTARKFKEAKQMTLAQRTTFQEFNHTIDASLTSAWEKMSTEPQLKNGKWTSPFLLTDAPAMSISAKVKELESLEHQPLLAAAAHIRPGAAAWVTCGFEIISTQKRIQIDAERWGPNPTAAQALDLSTHRKAVLLSLQHHHDEALQFIAVPAQTPIATSSAEADGHPENLKTLLPSDLSPAQLSSFDHPAIVDTEKQLLRVSCLKTLQTARSVTIQRLHVSTSHQKHARGQGLMTQAASHQTRLQECLDFAQWHYNHMRDRLVRLGMSAQDIRTFKPLLLQDLKSLQKDIGKYRPLGEGCIEMPWYWRVDLSHGPEDAEMITSSASVVQDEYNESLRVEWFRSRERYKRWEEEHQWLQCEAVSIILYFGSCTANWEQKQQHLQTPGWRAYASRQAEVWRTLRKNALATLTPILLEAHGPGSQICSHVARLYNVL